MRRLAPWLAAASWALGCSDPQLVLPYPPEVLDGTAQAAILLLQASERPDSEILESELIHLPPTDRRLLAVDDEARARLRLLTYLDRAPLQALALEPGPLPRAAAGEGRPLPEPTSGFLSGALSGSAVSWSPVSELRTELLPWRVPAEALEANCPDVSTEAILVPGFERVRPRAMLALSENEAVVAGQWNEADGKTVRETMLVVLSGLDGVPSFRSLGPALADQAYRGMVQVAPRVVLVMAIRGRVARVDLDSGEVSSARAVVGFAYWKLSRGEDGTVVAFDARDTPEVTRLWAHRIDPETLEATQLDAPEPFWHVSVVREDLMYAAGDRKLYRYAAGQWTVEHETQQPVTELIHAGDRVVAVEGGAVLLERAPDGTWTPRPHGLPIFDLTVGAFFPDGRLIYGGGAGFFAEYRGGEWCNVLRSVSREVMAISVVPGQNMGLAITYGEKMGESAVVTRLVLRE